MEAIIQRLEGTAPLSYSSFVPLRNPATWLGSFVHELASPESVLSCSSGRIFLISPLQLLSWLRDLLWVTTFPVLGDASDSHRERLLLLHLVFSLPLGKSLLFGLPWSSSHLSFLISHPCLLLSCLKHPMNPSPNSSSQFISLSFNKPRGSSFVPQLLFSLIAPCFWHMGLVSPVSHLQKQ